MDKYSTQFSIEGIRLDLAIGSTKERQPIEIDLWIFFSRTPLGCVSDEQKDRVSSLKYAEIILEEAKKKPFTLLEHLAYTLHKALKRELPMTTEVAIRVRQLHTSLPELTKGISFTYFPPREVEEGKKAHRWNEDTDP